MLALPERVEERLAVPEALGKFGVTFLGARLNPGVEVYDTMVYDRDAWPAGQDADFPDRDDRGIPPAAQRVRVSRFFSGHCYPSVWVENRVNMDVFFWNAVTEGDLRKAREAWPTRAESVCNSARAIAKIIRERSRT